jgi:hypothetical protein
VIGAIKLENLLGDGLWVQPNEAADFASEKTPHARGCKKPVAEAGVQLLALPSALGAAFPAPNTNALVLIGSRSFVLRARIH